MQKWQKNAILRAIQRSGLDPQQFIFEEFERSGSIPRHSTVKHRWSPSRFDIDDDRNRGHGYKYEIKSIIAGGQEHSSSAEYWWTLLSQVRRWSRSVKTDIKTPDLWAELEGEAGLLRAASEDVSENTPFTSEEQKEIATRLSAWAAHAQRTHSLSSAQMQSLQMKLDYLVDASRRFGRKDWLNLCAGTIVAYIFTASLPPDAAREMFLGMLRAVGHLYGLPLLPS
jgi:hypothetical protein